MRKYNDELTDDNRKFIQEALHQQNDVKRIHQYPTTKIQYPLKMVDNTLVDMNGVVVLTVNSEQETMLPLIMNMFSKHFKQFENLPYPIINCDTVMGATDEQRKQLLEICKQYGHNWKPNVFNSICSRCDKYDIEY